jgi:hypothetical protein
MHSDTKHRERGDILSLPSFPKRKENKLNKKKRQKEEN